jgi:hypothetical protein
VNFMVDKVALERVFLPLMFFPLSIIPSVIHARLHVRLALTRKTNGGSQGIFYKGILFRRSGSFG